MSYFIHPARKAVKSDDSTHFLPQWAGETVVSQYDQVSMPLETAREVLFQFLCPYFSEGLQQFLEDCLEFVAPCLPSLLLYLQRTL